MCMVCAVRAVNRFFDLSGTPDRPPRLIPHWDLLYKKSDHLTESFMELEAIQGKFFSSLGEETSGPHAGTEYIFRTLYMAGYTQALDDTQKTEQYWEEVVARMADIVIGSDSKPGLVSMDEAWKGVMTDNAGLLNYLYECAVRDIKREDSNAHSELFSAIAFAFLAGHETLKIEAPDREDE